MEEEESVLHRLFASDGDKAGSFCVEKVLYTVMLWNSLQFALLAREQHFLEQLQRFFGECMHIEQSIPGPCHDRLCHRRTIIPSNGQASQATETESEEERDGCQPAIMPFSHLGRRTHTGKLRTREVGPATPASPMQYVECNLSCTPNANLEATSSVGPLRLIKSK